MSSAWDTIVLAGSTAERLMYTQKWAYLLLLIQVASQAYCKLFQKPILQRISRAMTHIEAYFLLDLVYFLVITYEFYERGEKQEQLKRCYTYCPDLQQFFNYVLQSITTSRGILHPRLPGPVDIYLDEDALVDAVPKPPKPSVPSPLRTAQISILRIMEKTGINFVRKSSQQPQTRGKHEKSDFD